MRRIKHEIKTKEITSGDGKGEGQREKGGSEKYGQFYQPRNHRLQEPRMKKMRSQDSSKRFGTLYRCCSFLASIYEFTLGARRAKKEWPHSGLSTQLKCNLHSLFLFPERRTYLRIGSRIIHEYRDSSQPPAKVAAAHSFQPPSRPRPPLAIPRFHLEIVLLCSNILILHQCKL